MSDTMQRTTPVPATRRFIWHRWGCYRKAEYCHAKDWLEVDQTTRIRFRVTISGLGSGETVGVTIQTAYAPEGTWSDLSSAMGTLGTSELVASTDPTSGYAIAGRYFRWRAEDETTFSISVELI